MRNAYGQALLACDAVARDPAGKVTLYGIFDRIYSPKFPAIHSLFAIYWRCVAPGPGRIGVSVLRPDGASLKDLDTIETTEERPHSVQGTYTLGGVEFPVDGEYTLTLKYNGQEILRSSLILSGEKG